MKVRLSTAINKWSYHQYNKRHIVGQNPLLLLWWNFSIPDADFSCHPAHFTKSAAKCHQGIVAYCPLWLKYCNKITTQNISTFYEEMCCSLGFSIARNTQPFLSSFLYVISYWKQVRLPLCELQWYERNITYLNTIGQSHVSPHGCCASRHTTQATVFSILICCVATQCNWTDATKNTCTTEKYLLWLLRLRGAWVCLQWKKYRVRVGILNCTHRSICHCSRSTGQCSTPPFGHLSHSHLRLVDGWPLGLTFGSLVLLV